MSSKRKFLRAELFSLWDKRYKELLFIPIILLVIDIILILTFKPKLSYEFTGGYSYILESNYSYLQLKQLLSSYPGVDLKPLGDHRFLLQAPYNFQLNVSKLGKVISMVKINPVLGKEFQRSAIEMILIAFILLVISVFISFKEIVPGLLMILSIIFDSLTVIAAMCLVGIPFSLATISILLILVGYSIDTDILLTSRVLRHKHMEFSERFRSAMITGLTEQFTAFSVMLLGFIIVSLFFPELDLVRNMTLMVLVGSVADMIFTWLFNASALRIWVEKHGLATRS
jgi:preprotein translocase subunit SecF